MPRGDKESRTAVGNSVPSDFASFRGVSRGRCTGMGVKSCQTAVSVSPEAVLVTISGETATHPFQPLPGEQAMRAVKGR